MQAPIKERYRNDPKAGLVTLKAKGTLDDGSIIVDSYVIAEYLDELGGARLSGRISGSRPSADQEERRSANA